MLALVSLGAVLAAAMWSVPTVVIGLALDTVTVGLVWTLLLTFSPPFGPGPGVGVRSVRGASLAARLLLVVCAVLAIGAFASLSVGLTALGALVVVGVSPPVLGWIAWRRHA